MPIDELDALVERKKRGEEGLDEVILERIAKDVYERPRLYGFRSEDDVGEVFERYWTRIVGLVDRYEDVGSSFEAYLVSTLRYMALSMRRRRARCSDKDAVYVEESKSDIRPSFDSDTPICVLAESRLKGVGIPSRSDNGISARAFRRRILFLCVKCANMMDDDEAVMVARSVGLDEDQVLDALARARSSGLGLRRRTASRRRGRDAAWLRFEAASRRLSRETDISVRRALEHSIDRDRGLYRRAVALIAKSTPVISNKAVAELLGLPKGTVDCGVGRILRQYSALHSSPPPEVECARRNDDTIRCDK